MNNTVKVRIAVSVDSDGEWSAFGDNLWESGDCEGQALKQNSLTDGVVHWVTAEVPIPQSQEIKGSVEP